MSPDVVTFTTRNGLAVPMRIRPDTTDWNTVNSCIAEDEYALPPGLSGWALDIGSHVGSVAVTLALMNPALRVIAVEPLPENLDLLRENVAANGVGDRVVVLDGAITTDTIHYDFEGEGGGPHRYIGNAFGPTWRAQRSVTVETFAVADLRNIAGVASFAFAKIDCEGGEWGFLGPDCACIERIVGEWHPVDGHTRADVIDALGSTHWLTFTGPEGGPGGFTAVRA